MDDSTKKLLEECNSGCKMAVQSIDQVRSYVKNENLGKMLASYREKHVELEGETERLLESEGAREKAPNPMATAFSWMTTEMKMMMKDDTHQIAKLMMDGCNMGIQTISEQKNKLCNASHESKQLADKLVRTEEEFMGDLEKFI